ncbi:MAG: DUF2232 domain-containing protein [Clostridia bacterium]|nr:DUF2232 domain-containing protein [Clostridia bacterium]
MKDFPLYRSPKAAVVSTLLIALPLLLLSSTALSGLYAVFLVIFLLPMAACVAGMVGGLLPMTLGILAGLLAMARLAGARGATLAALYLLPIAACFVLVIALRVPFRQSCPAMIGVHVLALAGCYMLLQGWTGGSLYTAAGQAVVDALENWDLGDLMLYQLFSMGILDLPDHLQGSMLLPVLGGYTLSAAAKQDLLLSLNALVNDMLTALIPNLIVSQSILGGVGCLLLPLRFGYIAAERRAFLSESAEGTMTDENGRAQVDFPDLQMPRFETWHLPRGIGWQVGAALAAGYFLRASSNAAMNIAGILLYSAAHAVFTIQGAALVNFMQKSRGTKRVWRVIVPVLLMLLSVLVFLGIFDQISNIRGLRKPREPKEEI